MPEQIQTKKGKPVSFGHSLFDLPCFKRCFGSGKCIKIIQNLLIVCHNLLILASKNGLKPIFSPTAFKYLTFFPSFAPKAELPNYQSRHLQQPPQKIELEFTATYFSRIWLLFFWGGGREFPGKIQVCLNIGWVPQMPPVFSYMFIEKWIMIKLQILGYLTLRQTMTNPSISMFFSMK